MKRVVLVFAVAACGPAVSTHGGLFDEDVARSPGTPAADSNADGSAAATNANAPRARTEAPVGKGMRAGTIARASLTAVLDAGPGEFLRQLEVTPQLAGQRFVGWQLVQLVDHTGPLAAIDLAPGDVLLAVNGKPVAQPDQLQALWDSLRSADAVDAELWRGDRKVTLHFAVEPTAGAK